MHWFLFFFIATPMLEMWILIEVGSVIGSLPTIGLVALTAVIGAALLNRQGLSTLMRAQQRMNEGQLPATEIIEGLLLAVGGALLLTPGFVTDTIGFACLLPFTRRAIAAEILRRGIIRTSAAGFQQYPPDAGFGPGPATDRDGHTTIEGDFRREDDPGR